MNSTSKGISCLQIVRGGIKSRSVLLAELCSRTGWKAVQVWEALREWGRRMPGGQLEPRSPVHKHWALLEWGCPGKCHRVTQTNKCVFCGLSQTVPWAYSEKHAERKYVYFVFGLGFCLFISPLELGLMQKLQKQIENWLGSKIYSWIPIY